MLSVSLLDSQVENHPRSLLGSRQKCLLLSHLPNPQESPAASHLRLLLVALLTHLPLAQVVNQQTTQVPNPAVSQVISRVASLLVNPADIQPLYRLHIPRFCILCLC
jgi:hypothetical protein